MNKLSTVPATKRVVKFRFEFYKGNRIALKIVRSISQGDRFSVKDLRIQNTTRIFEFSIETDQETETIYNDFKQEIKELVPKLFPKNYQFDFEYSRLGFVNSFCVETTDAKPIFNVCHRIKEMRTNGTSNTPQRQIV